MRTTLVRLALGFGLSLGLAAPSWAQATKSTTTTTTTTKRAAPKVDLNTASVAELEQLPGVGPARAAEIVKARPFKSADELKALRGFSAPVMAELAPHVTVGERRVMTKSSTTTKGSATPLASKVDLNTASVAELEELPGVGPARAAEIVKARPFKSVDELKALRGFSTPVMAELTPHVTVSDVTTTRTTTKESMPKTSTKTTTKTTTKKAANPAATAREAAREDDPQHLSRKKAALSGRTINLNTATAEELEELPGIGPVRAAAIIKARPFETKEDIMKVEGIKEGIYGHVKDYISVK